MKLLHLALPLVVTILVSSCVLTKTYTVQEKKMKINDQNALVVQNDGKTITGNSLKLTRRGSAIKMDDQIIEFKDIMAYQNKTAYFVKFETGRNSFWVKQLKRGKINLYYYEVYTHIHNAYYDGSRYVSENSTDTYFVFNKTGEPLAELSITEIAQLLKTNKAAFTKFTSTFGTKSRVFLPNKLANHPKVLFEAIDIYNGDL